MFCCLSAESKNENFRKDIRKKIISCGRVQGHMYVRIRFTSEAKLFFSRFVDMIDGQSIKTAKKYMEQQTNNIEKYSNLRTEFVHALYLCIVYVPKQFESTCELCAVYGRRKVCKVPTTTEKIHLI